MNEGRRTRREYRMIAAPSDMSHTLLPASLLATGQGYAMVRRPGCIPFVITERAWLDAPLQGS